MRKRMLFVYNPRAGKAQIRSNLLDIIDIFVKAGYEVTAYPTQATGDAVKAVKERQGSYDMVACCGGGGTLDEVVNGMMQSEEKLPVGYIPAGSTNDFANSLKIPKNMIKAADVVVNGVNYACDIDCRTVISAGSTTIILSTWRLSVFLPTCLTARSRT